MTIPIPTQQQRPFYLKPMFTSGKKLTDTDIKKHLSRTPELIKEMGEVAKRLGIGEQADTPIIVEAKPASETNSSS